jgi:hypothetical protein
LTRQTLYTIRLVTLRLFIRSHLIIKIVQNEPIQNNPYKSPRVQKEEMGINLSRKKMVETRKNLGESLKGEPEIQ